jgi:CRP-like cAMP-binding protein
MPIAPKNRFKHDCDLPPEYFHYEVNSPYETRLRKLGHRLTNFITVYQHFDSLQYFRSNCAFRKERRRHLMTLKYKYIIHPFSMFARRKAVAITTLWMVLYFVETFTGSFLAVAFHNRDLVIVEIFLMVMNLGLLLDVITRFFVGYPVERTRVVILDSHAIHKKYLTTYFFFDLGAIMSYIIFYFGRFMGKRAEIIVFQFHKLRFARIKTLLDNTDMMLASFKVKESKRTCIILGLTAILLLHGFTCIFGLMPVMRQAYDIPYNQSFLYYYDREQGIHDLMEEALHQEVKMPHCIKMYITHMSMVMCHFFGCGTFRSQTKDSTEMLFLSSVLLSGLIFYVYTVAKVLQLFGVVNISEIKYEELNMQVSQYMVKKNFPRDLKKRINKYYDYKFNKKFFSEQRILDTLTEHLRMEVLLYSCRNLIGEVQIFKGLSKAAVGCVLALLKQEIYIPHDVIMAPDDESGSIYFILYGTCGIKLVSGKEVMHIEDGHHFGDTSDFEKYTKTQILYSVVALEVSEVYKLEKKDIKYCCKTYPEIVYKLEAMARNKAKRYNAVFSMRGDEDDETTGDILDELRRGSILHPGIKRQELL